MNNHHTNLLYISCNGNIYHLKLYNHFYQSSLLITIKDHDQIYLIHNYKDYIIKEFHIKYLYNFLSLWYLYIHYDLLYTKAISISQSNIKSTENILNYNLIKKAIHISSSSLNIKDLDTTQQQLLGLQQQEEEDEQQEEQQEEPEESKQKKKKNPKKKKKLYMARYIT